ncbi:MAG: hypothetical protein KF732_03590 [Flavobacteriales bacterium]|nr:MAG: hypothetical protein F9K09_01760 [Flavobacteriales bacterium]MBX2959019.1 hypothetical protein [Flavobacteriales bacterium]
MYFKVESIREVFILEVLRNFKFLLLIGYSDPIIGIYPLETNVSYSSKNREINITMPDPDLIVIEIINRSFSFKKNVINVNDLILSSHPDIKISGLLNENNLGIILKKYSDFIREDIFSIIKGEEWR